MVKKGKALKDSDAQNISGGYVHKTFVPKLRDDLPDGFSICTKPYVYIPKFEVINDVTGERMGNIYDTEAEAQKAAFDLKQKTKVISDNALNKLRVDYELNSD